MNRIANLAALAFAASCMLACASSGAAPSTGTQAPTPAASATPTKAAPSACTACKVEVENRFDFQALVFDKRDTSRGDVGSLTPLGKVLAKTSIVVQTRGRPNMGMTIHEDRGTPPTSKDLKDCRQEAVRPDSNVDYRYVCGF